MSEVDKLHDALERQSELIAGLRNEIATWKNGFAAANEALRMTAERVADVEAMYQHEATRNGLRMIEIGGLKKRIAELEAAQADGRTYSEGCTP